MPRFSGIPLEESGAHTSAGPRFGGVPVAPPQQAPIDQSRPILWTEEGPATERGITVELDDRVYNIPSIHNGRQLSDEQAIELFRAGEISPTWEGGSIEEGVAASKARSRDIGNVRRADMPEGRVGRGKTHRIDEFGTPINIETGEPDPVGFFGKAPSYGERLGKSIAAGGRSAGHDLIAAIGGAKQYYGEAKEREIDLPPEHPISRHRAQAPGLLTEDSKLEQRSRAREIQKEGEQMHRLNRELSEFHMKDIEGVDRWVADTVRAGVGSFLPMVGLGIVSGGSTVPLTLMGGQVFFSKYGDARASGRSVEESNQDALFAALNETLTEKIPLDFILKPGGRFLKSALKGSILEGTQEGITSVFQKMYDSGALPEGATWRDALAALGESETWKEALYEGSIGAALGGPVAGVIGEAQYQKDYQRYKDEMGWVDRRSGTQTSTFDASGETTTGPGPQDAGSSAGGGSRGEATIDGESAQQDVVGAVEDRDKDEILPIDPEEAFPDIWKEDAAPRFDGVPVDQDVSDPPETQAADEPGTVAPVAQQEVPAGENLASEAEDRDVELLEPDEIAVDAETFQFKSGGDQEGVTQQLRGTRQWDPKASGVSIVWERNDGQKFIVDGHQRLGLAKRLKQEGQTPTIRALVLRESEGISAEEARLAGAVKNLQEGGESTSAIDIARVIRDSGENANIEEVVPPNRAAYKDGKALAKLGELAWGMVINEQVNPSHAAVVAEKIRDPDEQVAALDVFQRTPPANVAQARFMADQIVQAGFEKKMEDSQGDILGGTTSRVDNLVGERAKVLDGALRRLRNMRAAFNNAIVNEASLRSAGNLLDTEQNQTKVTENAKLIVTLQQLANAAGPVSEALTKAARGHKGGASIQRAVDGFLESISGTSVQGDQESVASDIASEEDSGPVVDPGPSLFGDGSSKDESLHEARELLRQVVPKGNVASLSGPSNQGVRQKALEAILGLPVPKSKAGISRLLTEIADRIGAKEATIASRDKAIAEWVTGNDGIRNERDGGVENAPQNRSGKSAGGTTDGVSDKKQRPDTKKPSRTGRDDLSGSDKASDAKRSLKPTEKIEDFGEKILGARKDYAAKLKEARELEIGVHPLSKTWPAPDYSALIEDGVDPFIVAWVRAARDEIPAKPKASWKLKRWAEQVGVLRDVAQQLLNGTISKELLLEKLTNYRGLQQVVDRTELYELVGHEKSLKGVRIRSGEYSIYNGKEYRPPKTIWTVEREAKATAFSNWPRTLAEGNSREEAIAKFKKTYATIGDEKTERKIRFDVYSDLGKKEKAVFIGKKIGRNVVRLKQDFASVKDAQAYLHTHQKELEVHLQRLKDVPSHRNDTNAPRVGVDHRKGANVSPDQFQEAFGFRGVQFGNYVEGDRRQVDLNDAYDGLMDLAGVLNISPKALSLNGELGLAFGARGKGGKGAPTAHYEPGQVVINLTKKKGAGSLAHEWWHALDNYFEKTRRDDRSPMEAYSTETHGRPPGGMRPEVAEAFKRITTAVNSSALKSRALKLDRTRAKPYWSLGREMSARAFESYIVSRLQDQQGANDYLANIVSKEYWEAKAALGLEKEGTYPYLEAAEIPEIHAAFDHLFQVVEERQTDKGTMLFAKGEWGAAHKKGLSVASVKNAILSLAGRKTLQNLGYSLVIPETMSALRADMVRRGSLFTNMMFARGYHGSPHKFDEFDSSKIGTGEGAQAFGYGLYLSESPDVADTYRLANSVISFEVRFPDGKKIKGITRASEEPTDMPNVLDSSGGDIDAAIDLARSYGGFARHTLKRLEDWKAQGAIIKKVSDGSFLEVDIPDAMIERMLDWDAPLEESVDWRAIRADAKKKIDALLAELDEEVGGSSGFERMSETQRESRIQEKRFLEIISSTPPWTQAATFIKHIEEVEGGAAASQRLRQIGIPGIKYRAGQLSGVDSDAKNFVVFPGEEKNLTILTRNGEPVTPKQRAQALDDLGEQARYSRRASSGSSEKRDGDLESLYHGSYEEIKEITDDGLFGGVFASTSDAAALSHGEVLHRILIPSEKILDNFTLNYEIEYEAVLDAFRSIGNFTDEEIELLWPSVVEDIQPGEDASEILGGQDSGDAGWEAQRLRGKLAKALGFDAVEMQDEHGVSFLVLPGARITPTKKPLFERAGGNLDGVKGFYDPSTDTSYILPWNLNSEEEAYGVFLHEVGVHYGMEAMLGDQYSDALTQIEIMARTGNEKVLDAMRRVNIAENLGLDSSQADFRKQFADRMASDPLIAEETIAYLVEHNHSMPFVKRVMAAIRAFLYRIGVFKKLDDASLVALAKAATRHRKDRLVADGTANPSSVMAGTETVSAQWHYSQMLRVVNDAKQAKATPEQWLALFRKSGVKQEEIDWLGVEEWMGSRKTVERDDLSRFIADNQIVVEEQLRGGETGSVPTPRELFEEEWPNAFDEWLYSGNQEQIAAAWEDESHPIWDALSETKAGFIEEYGEEDAKEAFEESAENIPSEDLYTEEEWRDIKEIAWEDFRDEYERARYETIARLEYESRAEEGLSPPTKFDEYQLPGGEDYRELLLTLPRIHQNKQELRNWRAERFGEATGADYDGWNVSADMSNGKIFASEISIEDAATEQAAIDLAKQVASRHEITNSGPAANFRSTHYDEPNILAHVRFNEREDANGRRTLFLEEVQSDWMQTGRKRGFKRDLSDDDIQIEDRGDRVVGSQRFVATAEGTEQEGFGFRPEAAKEMLRARANEGTVPDAPFKQTWPLLAIKRMIRFAAENGYEAVAWTTGEQQADRYDLSKQVDDVLIRKASDKGPYSVIARRQGVDVLVRHGLGANDLDGVVGKELAEKARAQTKSSETYSGVDLKVGGEGMRGFYDKILPGMVNKYVKKWGGKVGKTVIDAGDFKVNKDGRSPPFRLERRGSPDIISRHETAEAAWAEADRLGSAQVHMLEITPKMRDSVLQGQPLFSRETGAPRNSRKAPPGKQEPIFPGFDIPSETVVRYIQRRLQDRFGRVKTLQRGIEKALGKPLPEKLQPYLYEELFYGKTEDRLTRFDNRFVKRLVRLMSLSNISIDELDNYLYARHAPERNAYIQTIRDDMGAGSGMSDAEAAEIMEGFEKRGKTEALERAANVIDEINNSRIDGLVSSGLLSEKDAIVWRSRYENYVPLRGFDEPDLDEPMISSGRPRTGRGYDIRGPESRQALGRESRAESPVLYTIMQAQESIVRAEKNEVGKALLRLVASVPNEGFWRVIDPKKHRKPAMGRDGKVIYRHDPTYKLADNVISVKHSGKEVYIELNDEGHLLARAFKQLGAEQSNQVLRFLAAFNRYLAIINTSLSPEFMFSNFGRDLQTAGVNAVEVAEKHRMPVAKLPALIARDVFKAMIGSFRGNLSETGGGEWGQWFREFRAAGGKIGFFGLDTIEAKRKRIVSELRLAGGGPSVNAEKAYRAVGGLIMDVNSAVENAVRLSAFVNLRRAGVSEALAASAARNLTVNFNRKGELGHVANALYLFYNAGIQGSVRLMQAMASSKKVQALGAGIAIGAFLLTEMNRLIGGDDEEGNNRYDQIPDYVRKRNMVIMRPEGDPILIPLPYGYNVFHVFGESLNAAIHGKDALETTVHFLDTVMESFNPLGTEDSDSVLRRIIKMVSPSFLDPAVQLAMNENFYGGEITKEPPPYEKYRSPRSSHYWTSTSAVSKEIAKQLNELTGGSNVRPGAVDISPDAIEHVTQFFTGSAGRFVMNSLDFAVRTATGRPKEISKVPFLRRMVYEIRPYYTQKDRYFQWRNELHTIKAEEELLMEHDRAKGLKFRAEHLSEIRLLGRLEAVDKRRRALEKDRKEALLNGDEVEARRIEGEIGRVLGRFNKEAESLKGPAHAPDRQSNSQAFQ